MENKILQTETKLESVPCNLCQGQDHKTLYKIANNQIVRCRKCGLIFVNPRPKEEEILKIYENDYFQRKSYDPHSEDFYGYVDYLADSKNVVKTFARVYKHIRIYKDQGKLLDIGCALGFFLDLARKNGWEPSGIEPSTYACSYAREKFNLPVMQNTLFDADLPEGAFDLATMFDVIEHFADPLNGLLKVNKCLKDGGLLAITTADADSLLGRLLGPKLEDVRRANEHLYVFSRKTIKEMLAKCGFEVLRIRTAGKYFSLGDLLERMTLHHHGFFRKLKSFLEKIKASNLTIYIDPGVKITVIAKKVRKVS